LRFSAVIIVLVLLAVSCGPKPDFHIITDGTPENIWESFLNRLPATDSIAIVGKIKVKSSKTFEFGFEAYYLADDSLNFSAHGPFGMGWFKVLLLGDSVFILNSKDRTPEIYNKNEKIYLGDTDSYVNVSAILKALFLEIPERTAEFIGNDREIASFRTGNEQNYTEIYINPENCFSVGQINKLDGESYRTAYSGWKMVKENQFYPTKIIMESSSTSGIMQLKINKIKVDPRISRNLFRK